MPRRSTAFEPQKVMAGGPISGWKTSPGTEQRRDPLPAISQGLQLLRYTWSKTPAPLLCQKRPYFSRIDSALSCALCAQLYNLLPSPPVKHAVEAYDEKNGIYLTKEFSAETTAGSFPSTSCRTQIYVSTR